MHAALIMIQFHKLAIISESLNIKYNFENSKKCTNIEKHDSTEIKFLDGKTNVKQKILKNLENLEDADNLDKSSNIDQESIGIQIDQIPENKNFDKHINKYYNIYHDFDAHSEEYRSYLVNILFTA